MAARASMSWADAGSSARLVRARRGEAIASSTLVEASTGEA